MFSLCCGRHRCGHCFMFENRFRHHHTVCHRHFQSEKDAKLNDCFWVVKLCIGTYINGSESMILQNNNSKEFLFCSRESIKFRVSKVQKIGRIRGNEVMLTKDVVNVMNVSYISERSNCSRQRLKQRRKLHMSFGFAFHLKRCCLAHSAYFLGEKILSKGFPENLAILKHSWNLKWIIRRCQRSFRSKTLPHNKVGRSMKPFIKRCLSEPPLHTFSSSHYRFYRLQLTGVQYSKMKPRMQRKHSDNFSVLLHYKVRSM